MLYMRSFGCRKLRLARKPSALARELLRNVPKGRRGRGQRRRRKGGKAAAGGEAAAAAKDGKQTGKKKKGKAGPAEEARPPADVVAEINGAADAVAAARAVEDDPGPAEEVLDEALESASTNGPVGEAEDPELDGPEREEIEEAVTEALDHDDPE